VCSLGGDAVAGLGQRVEGGAGVWSTYLSVEDVDTAVVQAARHGWQALAWNELMTRDRTVAEAFYGQVYGWQFEELGRRAP